MWVSALLIPSTLSLLMAWQAKELCNPHTRNSPPVFAISREMLAVQLRFAVAVAAAFILITLVCAFDAAWRVIRRSFGTPRLHWVVLAMLPVSWAPVVVRLMLPIEDPYNGEGSPAAVMLGLMVYAAIGLLFAMPGLFLLGSRWKPRNLAK